MACQRRFERPTDGLEVRCSIRLSYWHTLNRTAPAPSKTTEKQPIRRHLIIQGMPNDCQRCLMGSDPAQPHPVALPPEQ